VSEQATAKTWVGRAFEQRDGGVRLLGSRCSRCGTFAFPRREVCLRCGAETANASLSGRGRVHSWTVIETPPWGFDESLGYLCVDLEEGPRVLAPAVPGDAALAIGVEVRAVPAPVKEGHDGFRFEAVGDA